MVAAKHLLARQQPGRNQRFIDRHAAGDELLKCLRPAGQVESIAIEFQLHRSFELQGQFKLDKARQRKNQVQVPAPDCLAL